MNFRTIKWDPRTGKGAWVRGVLRSETRMTYEVPDYGLGPINPADRHVEFLRDELALALKAKRRDEKFAYHVNLAMRSEDLEVSSSGVVRSVQQWTLPISYNGKTLLTPLALNVAEQIEFDSLSAYADSLLAEIRNTHAEMFAAEKY